MAYIELTTDATVPTNTSLTVTVYEDTNADGTADNTATQSIGNGINTYTLSGFDGSTGNEVWIQAEPANTDVTTTASLNSADLSVAATQIGTLRIDKGGTVLDVPLYSLDSYAETWLRADDGNGNTGALHIIEATGEPLRARDPSDGSVVGVETN